MKGTIANKNKYINSRKGIETVCKNFDSIGTSITSICKKTALKKATRINGLLFKNTLNAELFSLRQVKT